MDHGYALAAGTIQTLPRKRKRSDEKRVEKGMKNDAEVARYLLDR